MSYDEITQKKINEYLQSIEKCLDGINVTDRADILMELNSHIQDSYDRSDQDVAAILKALGEPHQVANRFLIARGLKPVKPSRKPLLGKIALGFMGLSALALIALVLFIRSFFPLLEVNEEEGRVVILGGMIDVDEKNGKVSLGKGLIKVEDAEIQFDRKVTLMTDQSIRVMEFRGNHTAKGQESLSFRATNGKLKLVRSEGENIEYKCELSALTGEQLNANDFIYAKDKVVNFNFDQGILSGAECKIQVPEGLAAKVHLTNGALELSNLTENVDAEITNGKIKFKRDEKTSYAFNTWVRLSRMCE